MLFLEQQAEKYLKFAAMIATSMVVMFLLMYLNTYELSHVHWSQTRFYMTFIMGGAMAIVMLLFMLGMYRNKAVNIGILLVGAAMIIGALFLVRTQTPIADKSYMRAMIPHHSIAILTSEQAHIALHECATVMASSSAAQGNQGNGMAYRRHSEE